uniref:Uncharacterized protein n=1 Tax=Vespula pensylvanica TaxID=30213 RepID=A0A834KCB7_VESPE|nr:hypothetical protein H0235_014830 [Vespula pensylvanica]
MDEYTTPSASKRWKLMGLTLLPRSIDHDPNRMTILVVHFYKKRKKKEKRKENQVEEFFSEVLLPDVMSGKRTARPNGLGDAEKERNSPWAPVT